MVPNGKTSIFHLYPVVEQLLLTHNEYVRVYRSAGNLLDNTNHSNTSILIHLDEVRGQEKKGDEYDNAFARQELRAVYTVDKGEQRHGLPEWSAYNLCGGEEKVVNYMSRFWEPMMFLSSTSVQPAALAGVSTRKLTGCRTGSTPRSPRRTTGPSTSSTGTTSRTQRWP